MSPAIDWQNVDTVILDMDGTLLDLAFDSHFWLREVPQRLSRQRAIPLEQARALIQTEYHAVRHTLDWYSFDYWSERLGLDIHGMTSALGHTVRLRDDTLPFLGALRRHGLRTLLLTNAHPHGLEVKMTHTGLADSLDILISTHTLGYPKEDERLWRQLRRQIGFDPARTLFIDDGEAMLDAASAFGVRYCLGVSNPDSSLPAQRFMRHPALDDYRILLPDLARAFAGAI